MNDALKKYNVLVTRPKHQSKTLCDLIEQNGWNAVRFPTLEISSVNNKLVQQKINSLNQWHWLIFISVNAVKFAIEANNGKIDCFKSLSIAAVGSATAKALTKTGLSVDLLPDSEFNTEGLLATDEMNNVKGKSCLIVRGVGGRETLADALAKRGAKVDYLEVYNREIPVCRGSTFCDILPQVKLDAITITSGDALTNLLLMVGVDLRTRLLSVPLIVISDRIKKLAEKNNFKHIAVTDTPGDSAIIETLMMSLTH